MVRRAAQPVAGQARHHRHVAGQRPKQTTFDDYVRHDLYYVDNWSLLTDLAIVAKTVPVGAVPPGRVLGGPGLRRLRPRRRPPAGNGADDDVLLGLGHEVEQRQDQRMVGRDARSPGAGRADGPAYAGSEVRRP